MDLLQTLETVNTVAVLVISAGFAAAATLIGQAPPGPRTPLTERDWKMDVVQLYAMSLAVPALLYLVKEFLAPVRSSTAIDLLAPETLLLAARDGVVSLFIDMLITTMHLGCAAAALVVLWYRIRLYRRRRAESRADPALAS